MFEVVVDVLEDDVLDEFALVVLRVEEILHYITSYLYLHDILCFLDHLQDLILSAELLPYLLDPLEGDLLLGLLVLGLEDVPYHIRTHTEAAGSDDPDDVVAGRCGAGHFQIID